MVADGRVASPEEAANQCTTFVICGNTIVGYAGPAAVPKMAGMPPQKKTIRHDPIVARFGQRLRELRLARGLSQAELARQAEVTTNYVSRLEGGGAAPGIDLAARLAQALGTPLADLLPTTPAVDDLAATRQQAKKLFDELVRSEDRAVLLLLTQVLARLADVTNR
jgi:transcriptional regulator with XRE-family HTH domain